MVVRRRDDHKDSIDARVASIAADRMLEHRALTQAQILLRHVVTQTGADACGRNQRDVSKRFWHEEQAHATLRIIATEFGSLRNVRLPYFLRIC